MFLPCYECSGTEAPHQGRRDKLEHESFVTACHSLPRATSLNYTKQTTRKGARSLKTTFPNTQKKKKIKKGCANIRFFPSSLLPQKGLLKPSQKSTEKQTPLLFRSRCVGTNETSNSLSSLVWAGGWAVWVCLGWFELLNKRVL